MARRHTPEQVIAKVRQGQKMLNDGHPMIEVVKELQVTEATWYRWLNQYGSEKNAEASKRTKELEKENARLKRLLAEKELAIDILNVVAKGKFLSPEPRRRAVRMAVEKFGTSERFACKILGQNRSAFRKKKPDTSFEETRLRGALRAIAIKHPTWGWRKARWCLLAQEWAGMALNNKRVRRLWREEGLVCKPKARKKRRAGPGAGEQKRLTAEYPMHVVSFDFQSDVTSCGRHIRFFNVIDEYTRTALAIIARRSFTASDVVAALENIIAETGTAPTYVRCDNGPEFTAAALINWCNTVGVGTAFIDPGSPWQNGFVESFNAQFRREQLSGEIMDTMAEATYLAEEWKAIYNHERPHGSLDGMTPNRYWENWTQENQLAIA
ncbi:MULTISPECIES: IS3 family transposase [unclassified Rhodococcus (in: high G+C Gram-positive bacteria)]|uniref:IS3 family transposase n=1 Tax=unclassified Rhodococcus (in: high G+C Gram-positive bacteria) TaxID=192944 RepID=UPI000B3D341F|nr:MULTISPECIES: IS3 family transposase [unclassified Rhodococcus (in: high G+C Gram-positive bacteria)]